MKAWCLEHDQCLVFVWLLARGILWKAHLRIRNNDPEDIVSLAVNIIQAKVASKLIPLINHTGFQTFSVLDPEGQSIENIYAVSVVTGGSLSL